MGAVNPNLITQLIFQKRPVQNVLQQLAFAINARAGVTQSAPVFVSLLSAGGQTDNSSAHSLFVDTVTGSAPVTSVTTRAVAAGAAAPAGEVASIDMGFFLPSNATLGSTVTLRWGLWQPTLTTAMPRTITAATHSATAPDVLLYINNTPAVPGGSGYTAIQTTTFTVGFGGGSEIPPGAAVRVNFQLDATGRAEEIRLVACDVAYFVDWTLAS